MFILMSIENNQVKHTWASPLNIVKRLHSCLLVFCKKVHFRSFSIRLQKIFKTITFIKLCHTVRIWPLCLITWWKINHQNIFRVYQMFLIQFILTFQCQAIFIFIIYPENTINKWKKSQVIDASIILDRNIKPYPT